MADDVISPGFYFHVLRDGLSNQYGNNRLESTGGMTVLLTSVREGLVQYVFIKMSSVSLHFVFSSSQLEGCFFKVLRWNVATNEISF